MSQHTICDWKIIGHLLLKEFGTACFTDWDRNIRKTNRVSNLVSVFSSLCPFLPTCLRVLLHACDTDTWNTQWHNGVLRLVLQLFTANNARCVSSCNYLRQWLKQRSCHIISTWQVFCTLWQMFLQLVCLQKTLKIVWKTVANIQLNPKNEAKAHFCLYLSNALTESNNVWHT